MKKACIKQVLKGEMTPAEGPYEPIDETMANQLVRHLAFSPEGKVHDGGVPITHENPRNQTTRATLINHNGKWLLGVAHDSSHENAVVSLHIDMEKLFGQNYRRYVYVLRDRATRFYMDQRHRRTENDYAVIRKAEEISKLQVILKPGQFHFFEIIPVSLHDEEVISRVKAIETGQVPFDYARLGSLVPVKPNETGRHFRFENEDKLDCKTTTFSTDTTSKGQHVESDGDFTYFVSHEIKPYLDRLAKTREFHGEIQVYNIQGGNIKINVKNESRSVCETVDLNQPGSILLKNVTPGTEIEFLNLSGADFMIHQHKDPPWYIDRNHERFHPCELAPENESIYKSGKDLIELGILVVGLSNENDLDYDSREAGKVTPWLHVPGQPIRRDAKNVNYPSSAASLVIADSNTSNTIPNTNFMIYGDANIGVYPSEKLHHHIAANWSYGDHNGPVRPLEIYHVARGSMGLFIRSSDTEENYLVRLQAGDTIVIDPFVVHGIAYIETPYAHAVIQIPGVWDLAKLGGQFKHIKGDMGSLLEHDLQLKEKILKAMIDEGDVVMHPLGKAL